jgi:hypothetical protein
MRAEDFVRRLDGVRANGSGWSARCPAHDDRRASLSVAEGEDGRVLLRCHAGCEVVAVVAALGMTERDLFAPREERTLSGRIVATYDYTDEAGALLFQVVRFDPKGFRQRRPDGAGGWIWNLDGVRRVVFRLPRVLEAAKAGGVVFLVEGEKDVLGLERPGLTATTNAGGAGKWGPEYAEALRGCKGVVILPDNDEPGRKHARDAARTLHDAGVPVKVLELPGLPAKGDVSDWIKTGGTKKQLLELVKAVPRWEPAAGTDGAAPAREDLGSAVLVTVADVKPEPVEWLWRQRVPLAKVTVLDGDPGLGKSTLTLDLAARLSSGAAMPGESEGQESAGVVLLSGEDGIADTIRPRLEAANADLGRVVVMTAARDAEGKPRLPSLPDDVPAILSAIRNVGARLLVVDPLMAFLAGRVDSHRDQDVRGALAQIAEMAADTGAAVLIVRHLNKSQGGHPIYRGGGSIGIIGAARAGLLVAPDPRDQSRRVLAVTKSNLGPIPPSLAYRLVPAGGTSAVSWEGEAECTAQDLLAAQREDRESGGAREEARAFLRELLDHGPVAAKTISREAEGAGLAWATVRRAADDLRVRRDKAGMTDGWYWSLTSTLPAEGAHVRTEDAEDAHPEEVSTFGSREHLREPMEPAESARDRETL